MIKWILILGLLLSLAYAFLQRKKSRLVASGIAATSVAGMFFVVYPQYTSGLADLMGVGRGADLVFYCWIVISLFVSMNLQFKILNLQGAVTELTRELALRAPLMPEVTDGSDGTHADPSTVSSTARQDASG